MRLQFTTGRLLFITALAAALLSIGVLLDFAWYGMLITFGPLWLIAIAWGHVSNTLRVLSVGAFLAYFLILCLLTMQLSAMAARPRPLLFGPELPLMIATACLAIIGMGMWAYSLWRNKR